MRLTGLVLSGFKSFAETVELPFEEGVTAIVGPNGCGKSNVSDAVRWVLGEQRARLLRGAKMEEVIFHGAAKHKPVSLAEVSLTFDNSSGILPIAYHEVVLTRRLSRSGQSDYLINNSPVRLRDMQDLLRGTGLGGDAGVVIEAQMIDRLLSDRTDERRSLFEEAAGIGLYRDRKISTERRLQQTTEDMVRLDDRINEVQTLVRSLARQRGKAERARKLRDERFALVLTVARQELGQLEARQQELETGRAGAAEALPRQRHALAELEREREANVQARATAEARRTEVERRLATARLDVGRLEGDLSLATERIQHAAERVTRAREERVQAEARATQAEREREAAATERRAAVAARQSVQTELDLRTRTEDDTRGRLATERDRGRALEEELHNQAERRRALAGEREVVERDVADLRAQVTEFGERRGQATREQAAATQRAQADRTALEATERADREAQAALEGARHSLASAREREQAVRVERRAAEESQAQLTVRRAALDELERDRVGLAPAALKLLGERATFGAGAVLGPLSDFLRATPETAGRTERLLGDWLHAVLVRDAAAAEAVRVWHQRTQPGPLALLPVTPGPAARGGAAPAIQVTEPAGAWVRELLSGQEVLDADGRAIRRANGAIFLPGGEGSGPLQRRAELDRMADELTRADARTKALDRDAAAAVQAQAAAEQAQARAAEAVERARTALFQAQGAADDAGRLLQRADRELAEASDAWTRATHRAEERGTRLSQVTAELAQAETARVAAETALQRQRQSLAELEAAQDAARERRVHWQVEEAQVSAREQAAAEREGRADAMLAEARAEIAALERELSTLGGDSGGLSEQRAQWTETLAERRVAVQQLDAATGQAAVDVASADRALADAEGRLAEARHALEALNERAHRMEVDATELLGRQRAIVERIEAEWQRPIAVLLAEAPTVEGDPAQLREEAEQLAAALEALGPVNPLAVDEHAEESARLDDLTTQRADIAQARDSLQQALKEIDVTARGLFVETFAKIRENFHSVFHTLFEGGECDVYLANEADPLMSDIEIHAAPRGKRTQRIHLLSSGERALVAISLLFSIYLTKPSPFCLLDEVDAPLDDANVVRFVRLLSEFKADTQFIVITHNPRTMQAADAVYGVTMQEPGVSTIVGVRLGEVEPV
jgi:chromosome segregation protein